MGIIYISLGFEMLFIFDLGADTGQSVLDGRQMWYVRDERKCNHFGNRFKVKLDCTHDGFLPRDALLARYMLSSCVRLSVIRRCRTRVHSGSRDLLKFWEISANISETVQDNDI